MIEEDDKHVLGLELPTDPRWVNIAEMSLEEILVDHAFCEQKAATSCISLIVQFSEKQELVDILSPIVKEEWAHFEQVLSEMKKRGFSLGKPRKDEYVNRLNGIVKKGGSRAQQLVEKLLINALIEARSCERFRQLWKFISDQSLSRFYYKLMVSEAGHYKTFLEMAKNYLPEEQVMTRWKEILRQEAEIVKTLEVRADRMH
ncbi:MAG: tRNA-(ms[2]io[6]A)-hydroxylase [Cyclobacteriaceae bacterium]|nr:tRNA-(ms[2]io[6]A)-hydroxylase [Cyclobacteriaceae bacterium]